jgi:hypothetical protein
MRNFQQVLTVRLTPTGRAVEVHRTDVNGLTVNGLTVNDPTKFDDLTKFERSDWRRKFAKVMIQTIFEVATDLP